MPSKKSIKVNSDNLPAIVQANPKYDFTITPTPKKLIEKLKLPIIFLLSIVILGGIAFTTASYASPMVSINTEAKLSNEPVSFSVKGTPFFVKYNNKTEYSKLVNGVYTINLGNIEGENQFAIGSYFDLGITKIHGNKTKLLTLKRDYTAPKATLSIDPIYSSKVIEYKINVDQAEKDFAITNGEETIFNTDGSAKKCTTKEKNILNCTLDFGDKKETILDLKIVDTLGNSAQLSKDTIKLVEPNIFECNKDFVENEGKLSCKSSKASNITYNGKTIDMPANVDTIINDNIENGTQKIEIKIIDSDKLKSEFNTEYSVDKDKLTIDMWSDKWEGVSSMEYYSGKDVIAKFNKDVTVKVQSFLVYNSKSEDISNDPVNSRIKILQRRINASQPTKFLSYVNEMYAIPGEKNDNYYLLDFTADNGKQLLFRCNHKFMCNPR